MTVYWIEPGGNSSWFWVMGLGTNADPGGKLIPEKLKFQNFKTLKKLKVAMTV